MIWTPTATRLLTAISHHLESEAGPSVAETLEARLRSAAEGLSDFPYIGRRSVGGARVLVTVPPYLIRYRVAADHVFIIGVRHGARRPLA